MGKNLLAENEKSSSAADVTKISPTVKSRVEVAVKQ